MGNTTHADLSMQESWSETDIPCHSLLSFAGRTDHTGRSGNRGPDPLCNPPTVNDAVPHVRLRTKAGCGV
jgi:hypothetical protein